MFIATLCCAIEICNYKWLSTCKPFILSLNHCGLEPTMMPEIPTAIQLIYRLIPQYQIYGKYLNGSLCFLNFYTDENCQPWSINNSVLIFSAFVCMFIRRENFADQIYIESQYVHFWNDLGLFVGFLSALGMSIVANFQVFILLQHPHSDRFLFYFAMLLHGGVLKYLTCGKVDCGLANTLTIFVIVNLH